MNTKTKKILRTVAMVIIALMVVGGGVWMITGRSPSYGRQDRQEYNGDSCRRGLSS